jgi:hypothetical protein
VVGADTSQALHRPQWHDFELLAARVRLMADDRRSQAAAAGRRQKRGWRRSAARPGGDEGFLDDVFGLLKYG